MNEMNAIKKIYVGFASLLVLLVLLSAIMIYQALDETVKVKSLAIASEKRELADDMKLDVVQVQQWLTDISATRGAAGFDDGLKEAETFAGLFKEHSGKLARLFAGTPTEGKLKKLDSSFDSYYEFGKKMAAMYIKEGPGEGNKLMGEFDPIAEAMTKSLEEVVVDVNREFSGTLGGLQSSARANKAMGYTVAIIGLLLGIGVAIYIASTIKTKLTHITENLVSSSNEVNSAAAQISDTSQSLAGASTEQAASLEETSATMDEISAMAAKNTTNTEAAEKLTVESMMAVTSGAEYVKGMVTAIDAINASSAEVLKIIKTIEEIAFQTNLLALNAAVEAARAGEQGKGFAVVAEEVRNLARRSSEAAKSTNELISSAAHKSQEGSIMVHKAADSFQDIYNKMNKLTAVVSDVLNASHEQAKGVEQVNVAVRQMNETTQQNAASSEETAAAGEELNAQAASLNSVALELSRFVGVRESRTNGKPQGPKKKLLKAQPA